MIEHYRIAGYCRISVDEEAGRDNVSIENQKAILEAYAKANFPDSELVFYEDRDRSGYTFEQREGYQALRRELMRHEYDILLIKDFSRFSRRNSRGLVELEDLRDAGIRIISVGDNVDFPNDDDWLKIQFQFLINEMPVTDTSKKVRNVIHSRMQKGEWICAAPYGYILNKRKQFEIVPTEAEVIRTIFDLYNNCGWGYKRIADYLTEEKIPTPRMSECMRKEAADEPYRREVRREWSIITVQNILDNDFYIGTLRQGKTARTRINGKQLPCDDDKQIIIEKHHQAIIDYRTFSITRTQRAERTRSNYRGVKKYENPYSGFLFCGDCGAPLFATRHYKGVASYTCGTYHKRGAEACSSHHIRADVLDDQVKSYIRMVMENSQDIIDRLNADLEREQEDVRKTECGTDNLTELADKYREELKETTRQHIRQIMEAPEKESIINEIYDELEAVLQHKIDAVTVQIERLANRRNAIIETNRMAKTALDVFHDILEKDRLDHNDLALVLQKIMVYENRIEIYLLADIDTLLRDGTLEEVENFKSGTENIEQSLTQSAQNHADKVFSVHLVREADPLEIYTEHDGEVIFKKYSPMGDLTESAAQLCDSITRNTGHIAVVSDRDGIIAAAGASRRELLEKRNSQALSRLMEDRKTYRYEAGDPPIPVSDQVARYHLGVATPILSEGDLMGCAMLLLEPDDQPLTEPEQQLVQTVAGFLGRQLES